MFWKTKAALLFDIAGYRSQYLSTAVLRRLKFLSTPKKYSIYSSLFHVHTPKPTTTAILPTRCYHYEFINDSNNSENEKGFGFKFAGVSLALFSSIGFAIYWNTTIGDCDASHKDASSITAGVRRKDMPDYHRDVVREHNSKKTRIWVTYKDGVYDITDYVEGHPGGEKIHLAAGGSLEPFWDLYNVHKNDTVYEMLEELRIGNIHPDDAKGAVRVKDADDPYANDPDRHPVLRLNSSKPCNAEPPPELLADSYLTPSQLFFIRNHLPVPKVDMKKFKLQVEGIGVKKPLSITLDELKKYEPHTIVAAIQCAGNRRSDMSKVKGVKGLSWGISAIGNAKWTGVLLSDVLKEAGVNETDDTIKHVLFQGLDRDPLEHVPYEASVPAETALDPRKEVLIAYKMNDEDLPVDHGYPLRVIIPGVVGARQVKWLSKIILSKEESNSHWQKKDYKTFNPSVDFKSADFSKAVPIQEYPIQSAILEPVSGSTLADSDEITVKGYAWSGGGRGIIRVDVSIDGGKTWHEATLEQAVQKMHRQWAWALYQCTLPLPAGARQVEVICKATDTSHNSQPESAEGIWNIRGLIHNAWHRIQVNVPDE